MRPLRVLIVEDDEERAATLATYLSEAEAHAWPPIKWERSTVGAPLCTFRFPEAVFPQEVVLLGQKIADMDSYSVIEAIRRNKNKVPIMVLGDKADGVTGLNAGADDFMDVSDGPPDAEELLARICAMVRRADSYRFDETTAEAV